MYQTSPIYITRFLAAFGVLALHFYDTDSHLVAQMGDAVNYFFFISGFVMVISYQKYIGDFSGFSIRDFYIKRLARIYPLYLLAFLFSIPFFLDANQGKLLNFNFTEATLEIFGVHRWFFYWGINTPGWTISCEFLFYLLFPFIFKHFNKVSHKRKLLIGLLSLFFCVVFNHIWQEFVVSHVRSDYSYLFRNAEISDSILLTILNHPLLKLGVFILGMACGYTYLKIRVPWHPNMALCVSLVMLCCIAYALFLLPKENALIEAGLIVPFYFVFVLALCNLGMRRARLLGNGLFVLLGDLSYGIYILQVPVFWLFTKLLGLDHLEKLPLPQFMLYVVFLTVVSATLYYIYELPSKKILLRVFLTGRKLKQ